MNSHRYAFVEFRDADAAAHALNELNEHPFDTKHTFLVNRFADIENFADLDETYVEPPREEYHTKVHCRFFPETVWIDEVIEQFKEVVEWSITVCRSRGTHIKVFLCPCLPTLSPMSKPLTETLSPLARGYHGRVITASYKPPTRIHPPPRRPDSTCSNRL